MRLIYLQFVVLIFLIFSQTNANRNHSLNTLYRDSSIPNFSDGCIKPVRKDPSIDLIPKECVVALLNEKSTSKTIISDLPTRIRDWGSDGRGGIAWKFDDEKCNLAFQKLFEDIVKYSLQVHLSPHDLFHAHLIGYGPNKKMPSGLAMVFHAKEYPSDLDPLKNQYQLREESFKSSDKSFADRNFIYFNGPSIIHTEGSSGNVFAVNNTGSCRQWFSESSANTLSESKIAEALQNGSNIGDINIFAKDKIERINYKFYGGVNDYSGEYKADLEGYQTGRSVMFRVKSNSLLSYWTKENKNGAILYFLTGLK